MNKGFLLDSKLDNLPSNIKLDDLDRIPDKPLYTTLEIIPTSTRRDIHNELQVKK